MIRPLTIVTFLMACGSGLYLYQSKHEAQVLDRTIEKTVRDTSVYREQSRLLAAEWTMLNDPEMLRRFADTYLTLKTITPSQFTSLADLDSRLPPVQSPASADGSDEDASATLAAIPNLAPATSVSNETVPGMTVESPVQAPRPAALPPAATAVSESARPAERRANVGSRGTAAEMANRSPGADASQRWTSAEGTYRSAGTDAAKPFVPEANSSPRVVAADEGRASEHRPNDPRSADRHVPQVAETRGAEARGADARASTPQPRPTTVAAAIGHPVTTPAPASPVAITRINTNHPPIPLPSPTVTQSALGGSLLGMAHGSISPPVPRPTPVSTAQW